jgi:glycosyltransferase involved in cell wall biosynthesis
LHGPSFIDTLILPNGGIKKNALFYFLKYLKVYGIYDGANFLTHGKYTKRISEINLPKIGIKPRRIDYIYTPVKVDFDVNLEKKDRNTVLSFGRIMPDKNIENILSIARNSNAKFTIAGYVSPDYTDYLRKLEKEKPSNVKILPNPDENTKKSLFMQSWTYIHPKPMEHFGVSVAEAISYGCVPVVPSSGGVWEDVVDSGKFGLGYDTLEEASQKVDESFHISLGERMNIYNSRERFSPSQFNSKFLSLFSEYVAK